jgi:hypothetical protein
MTSLGSGWIQVVPSGVQATPDATLFLLPNENEAASLVSIVGEPATMDAIVHIPGLHAGVIRVILANPQPTRDAHNAALGHRYSTLQHD